MYCYLTFFIIMIYMQVREHLEIYAVLKGVEEDHVENTVSAMVDEVSVTLHMFFNSFRLRFSIFPWMFL